MGHIPTKLHQFLIRSFRNFVQTDRRRQKQYLLAAELFFLVLCSKSHSCAVLLAASRSSRLDCQLEPYAVLRCSCLAFYRGQIPESDYPADTGCTDAEQQSFKVASSSLQYTRIGTGGKSLRYVLNQPENLRT